MKHASEAVAVAFLTQALLLSVLTVAPAGAQIALQGPDTAAVPVDPSDVESAARSAQARFESRRIGLLPLTYHAFGGSCDEVVGRICTTYDEGEWIPRAESAELDAHRRELLAELDSLQLHAPESGWILGQRVWYRAEGGDWETAHGVAAGCGRVERWWCLALEGFALHGLEDFERSRRAFGGALALMPRARARRWRVPRWPVDGEARDLLAAAAASPFHTSAFLERLWRLADPLYLVEGNDRLTAHYARWTVAELQDGARNPFRLPWGDDLTQLTVRHGWQLGWERAPSRSLGGRDQVVGHNHPLGRDYMPSGEVLADPVSAPPEAMHPRVRHPRSLYAPPYAPVLLPMEGQVAVFPRGATVAVVATHFLPEDTTFHADHRHPVPWMDPGAQAEMPDRVGLFALAVADGGAGAPAMDGDPVEGSATAARSSPAGPEARLPEGGVVGVRHLGSTAGASLLEVAPGDYVISAESWSPARRRAGRLRRGLRARTHPPDIAALSDLLLLRPAAGEPASLEAALELALPRARLRPGEPFAIGWEVAGLGFRPETLAFEVSVDRPGRGLLRRIGDALGVSEPPRPLVLTWEEAGPDRPGELFRYLALEVPDLEEGEYEVSLTLRTAGRSPAVSVARFQVVGSR